MVVASRRGRIKRPAGKESEIKGLTTESRRHAMILHKVLFLGNFLRSQKADRRLDRRARIAVNPWFARSLFGAKEELIRSPAIPPMAPNDPANRPLRS